MNTSAAGMFWRVHNCRLCWASIMKPRRLDRPVSSSTVANSMAENSRSTIKARSTSISTSSSLKARGLESMMHSVPSLRPPGPRRGQPA